jgi:ketosteroid isomerase-like protein
MPEEPAPADLIELVRRTFAAFSADDLDAVTGAFAADAEWESKGLGTSFQGIPAIRSFLADWRGRYQDYEIVLTEAQDLGNGVIVIKSSQSGNLLGSPASARLPPEIMLHVFVWEREVATRIVSSGDTPEARAAAQSLAEQRA